MLEIFNTCWHIIQYVLYGVFAFFHVEEVMIILLADRGVPIWIQIVLILPFNTILIGIEVLLFRQIRRLRKIWYFIKRLIPIKVRRVFNFLVKSIKQRFFKQAKNLDILKGRPIGRRVLFSLGIFPECQKVGSFTLVLLIEKLGWQGFVALCFGGACRLTIYILIINTLLPTNSLWAVVIIFISLTFISWLVKRNKKLLNWKKVTDFYNSIKYFLLYVIFLLVIILFFPEIFWYIIIIMIIKLILLFLAKRLKK